MQIPFAGFVCSTMTISGIDLVAKILGGMVSGGFSVPGPLKIFLFGIIL
jgi:hypothetical protein